MSESKRAARFSPCEECGTHGHIVCANGEKSREFGTIFKGLEVLRTMLLNGSVTRAEGLVIMRQLERSKLVPQDHNEDRMLETLLEIRGGSEEGLRDLFDEVHRVMDSGEVESEKQHLH